MPVHPTAIVAAGAKVAADADIGPFCLVGPHVTIGAQTRLVAHVVLQGRTTLGARNVVHPFACLGGPPQDLKYRGEPTELWVGNDNTLREGVTLNIGTQLGGRKTRVGNHCLLMAYAHVAHDCSLGDNVILANGVGLAGHVMVDDNAILGGLAAVHQHCRIGRLAFVGGGSMVAQDVLPFCVAQGDRAQHAGLNLVGLRRQGFGKDKLRFLREALRTLFARERPRQENLARAQERLAPLCDEVFEMLRFARGSARGISAFRQAGNEVDAPDRAATAGPRRGPHESTHGHGGNGLQLQANA